MEPSVRAMQQCVARTGYSSVRQTDGPGHSNRPPVATGARRHRRRAWVDAHAGLRLRAVAPVFARCCDRAVFARCCDRAVFARCWVAPIFCPVLRSRPRCCSMLRLRRFAECCGCAPLCPVLRLRRFLLGATVRRGCYL